MNIVFIVNSILLGIGLAMDAFSVSCANGLREPKMKLVRMSMIAGVYAFFQFLMPMIGWTFVHTAKEYLTVLQGYIPWIALVLLCWIGGKMILEGMEKRRQGLEPVGEDFICSHEDISGNVCPEPAAEQAQPSQAQSSQGKAQPSQAQPSQGKAQPSQAQSSQGKAQLSVDDTSALTASVLLVQGIATSIDALSVGFTIADYDVVLALAACLIIAVVTFVICMAGLVIGRKVGEKLAGKADILGGVILIAIGIEIVMTHYFLP